jgi:hypothetical protein
MNNTLTHLLELLNAELGRRLSIDPLPDPRLTQEVIDKLTALSQETGEYTLASIEQELAKWQAADAASNGQNMMIITRVFALKRKVVELRLLYGFNIIYGIIYLWNIKF